MRIIIAALALLSVPADPVFAAGSPSFGTTYPALQPGYHGVNPNGPALAGGGGIGPDRLQPVF